MLERSDNGNTFPILAVVTGIVVLWYLAAVWMNAPWAYDQAQRANTALSLTQLLGSTMVQERPVLPAPHQVAAELWDTIVNKPITSKRSLVYHAWITLSATLLGFALGTTFGVLLAVLIVHNVAADKSLMPWIIATQTIPILAIAPMIIVVLNAIGISGLLPKALISTYLSFFPVAVGMVKGLRSPEPTFLDLMRTYNASGLQTFWKLKWPSALPYLFISMKVAVAISLVGAIVWPAPITARPSRSGPRCSWRQPSSPFSSGWSASFTASLNVGWGGRHERRMAILRHRFLAGGLGDE